MTPITSCVAINGYSFYPTNSDVSQGSVGAPALFLLYINDLLTKQPNHIHAYANDSTIYSNVDCPKQPHKIDFENRLKSMQKSVS